MTTRVNTSLVPEPLTKSKLDYISAWRELWLDHVYWTRLTVLGIVHDVPGLDQTEARLLRSVDDMIALMTPYYGEQAVGPFRQLVRDHLLIAAQLVTEAKQGQSEQAAMTEKNWYTNADQMSEFLSTANPNIDFDEMKDMFYRHLKMTKDEAVMRLTGQYDSDTPNYDNIQSEALMMSDMISTAIISQFSDKFMREAMAA